MTCKLFTPVSARAALERVRPAAERMCRIYRAMKRASPAPPGGDRPVDREYFTLARSLVGTIQTLTRAGVRISDPGSGLIDFPARRAGRSVLLCWRVGEPTLGFWHHTDSGHGDRRPLDEDGPWDEGPPKTL